MGPKCARRLWETKQPTPQVVPAGATGEYRAEEAALELLLEELKRDYGYNELDTFLVLKDILAQVWYRRKKLQKEAGRP